LATLHLKINGLIIQSYSPKERSFCFAFFRSSKGSARNFYNGFGNGNGKNGKTSSNNSQNENTGNDTAAVLIEEVCFH
jgi:hypothetical protein